MSAFTDLDALNALIPDLKAHMPEMAALAIPLISELRMIEKMCLDTPRSRLGPDLTNLTEQLAAVLAFRSMGVTNEDITSAEDALSALITDMRGRATGLIRERTSGIRINAEVAAYRTNPDLQPTDITEGYRLLTTSPVVDRHNEDGEAVRSFDFPDMGGPFGRMIGHFVSEVYHDPDRYRDDLAPLDTFLLPAGRMLHLIKGEQIILRTQGVSLNDDKLGLRHFKDTQTDYLIEVFSDRLTLIGPMTFSPHSVERGRSFSDLLSLANDLEAKNEAFAMSFEYTSSKSKKDEKSWWKILGLFSPGERKKENELFIKGQKILDDCDRLLEMFHDLSNTIVLSSRNHRTPDTIRSNIEHVRKRFPIHHTLRSYPIRSAVVRERQGLRVIEPLKALAAPLHDVNADLHRKSVS